MIAEKVKIDSDVCSRQIFCQHVRLIRDRAIHVLKTMKTNIDFRMSKEVKKLWASQVSTSLSISFLMNLERKEEKKTLLNFSKSKSCWQCLVLMSSFKVSNPSETLWRIQSSDCLLRAWLYLKLNIFQQGNLVKVRSKDREWKCTHKHTHKRKSF